MCKYLLWQERTVYPGIYLPGGFLIVSLPDLEFQNHEINVKGPEPGFGITKAVFQIKAETTITNFPFIIAFSGSRIFHFQEYT